jgi:hypothetical protein
VPFGVDHSTVAYQLHRAGVNCVAGPRRHDVDTQHILDLRDQEHDDCYRRSGGDESSRGLGPISPGSSGEAAGPFRTAPIRMTPWQKMLAGALNEHDAIFVRATVITPPWSEADRAQITAARRAAHRLVAADLARTVHVQVRAGDMLREVNHLVLVRSERYGVA